jgi:hypothetical protein
MYCDLVRSKKTWPLPLGPPVALYVGRLADPTAAFMRFGTDANEGTFVREMKVSHDMFEYGFMTHSPVNPATHVHTVLAASEDWFCAHVVHSCTPVMFLNLPASQPTHARAYTTSNVSAAFSTCVYPALHTHCDTFVDAATEVRFTAHDAHAADPVAFLNLPGTQATHTSPSFAVYPALHEHSALPASDLVFAGQLRQADAPRMRLYAPAGHAWHPLPAASATPVKPALHWHATLPAAELVLPGHATHVPFAWYVPAAQAEQVRLNRHLDGAFGNCTKYPSVQFRHAVAPDSEYRALEQFVHAAPPLTFLYVPTAHAGHGLFFSGIEPTTCSSIMSIMLSGNIPCRMNRY